MPPHEPDPLARLQDLALELDRLATFGSATPHDDQRAADLVTATAHLLLEYDQRNPDVGDLFLELDCAATYLRLVARHHHRAAAPRAGDNRVVLAVLAASTLIFTNLRQQDTLFYLLARFAPNAILADYCGDATVPRSPRPPRRRPSPAPSTAAIMPSPATAALAYLPAVPVPTLGLALDLGSAAVAAAHGLVKTTLGLPASPAPAPAPAAASDPPLPTPTPPHPDVIAALAALLRSIATHLSPGTLHLFFHPSAPTARSAFPLASRALDLVGNDNPMVRAAMRAVVLHILAVARIADDDSALPTWLGSPHCALVAQVVAPLLESHDLLTTATSPRELAAAAATHLDDVTFAADVVAEAPGALAAQLAAHVYFQFVRHAYLAAAGVTAGMLALTAQLVVAAGRKGPLAPALAAVLLSVRRTRFVDVLVATTYGGGNRVSCDVAEALVPTRYQDVEPQTDSMNPWRVAIFGVFDVRDEGTTAAERMTGALGLVLAVLQAPAVPHATFDALGIVPGRIAKARKLLAGLGATSTTTMTASAGVARVVESRRGTTMTTVEMQAAFRPPTPPVSVETAMETVEGTERPGTRPMSPWRQLMADDAPESPSADPSRGVGDNEADDVGPNHAVYVAIARVLECAVDTPPDRTVVALVAAVLLETRCVRASSTSGSGPRMWTPLPMADAAPRTSVRFRVARAVRAYVAAHQPIPRATAVVADVNTVLADIGTLLDTRPASAVRAATDEQLAGTMLLAWHLLVAPFPVAPPPVVDPVVVAPVPVIPAAGRRQSVHHHHRGALSVSGALGGGGGGHPLADGGTPMGRATSPPPRLPVAVAGGMGGPGARKGHRRHVSLDATRRVGGGGGGGSAVLVPARRAWGAEEVAACVAAVLQHGGDGEVVVGVV
ncbi:hypothetical protein GGF32_004897 [Allomyces javanicus]|nr:hypothetical protein GGF32_004897 [Allomyces javanicus]